MTNNQAEYEACITGLVTAKDLEARKILVCCDSLLVVTQAGGQAQVKDPILELYVARLRKLASFFEKVEFRHVPRLQNERADVLANWRARPNPALTEL